MIRAIGAVLSTLLIAVGAVAGPDASAVGIALAVVATAALALMLAVVGCAHAATTASTRPGRAIDASVLLPQSDPDAAGHARPRAPGFAA